MRFIFRIFIFASLCYLQVMSCNSYADNNSINEQDNSSCKDPQKYYLSYMLYNLGALSNIVAISRTEGPDKAEHLFEKELSNLILVVGGSVETNSCKWSKEELDKANKILLVVAAINQKFPMTEINNSKLATDVLNKAIAADPQAYKKILENYNSLYK